ncbi:hypothetical protein [Acetobacter sp.]|uniref:Uncharacterized protein n=1 Tax=Gluconobacter oxydans NBRC 3293 TaxID=1315969 RepID=A0A829WSP1_GLUOY|nr:hypothetical protein NBRC3293_0378 [Gluconobacter oxydans NBRC 3293]
MAEAPEAGAALAGEALTEAGLGDCKTGLFILCLTTLFIADPVPMENPISRAGSLRYFINGARFQRFAKREIFHLDGSGKVRRKLLRFPGRLIG